ncbi:efflux RND transporter permease subunit [Silanimonas lenta]|uniref:efflux RND transporter permease subunit n=1 Tax=Silanimonas lenta TaxID=265429 RepID=UPI001B7FB362|nr:MMPL family transporter [Silanimonas lenta]
MPSESMPPMGGFQRAADRFVFGFRPVMLLLIAAVTVAMVFFASQLRVDAGFKKQIPLAHEYMRTYLDYEQEFGGANRVLIAVMAREGDIFNQRFMQTLEKVTQRTMAIEETDDARVRSLFTPNVRFVEVVEDGFAGGNVIPDTFTPNVEGFVASEADFDTIRSNIVKANIVGRLVAKDWSGAMVWAELVPETEGNKVDYQKVARELEAIRTDFEDEHHTVHIIGFAKIVGDISDGARSVVMFFAITVALTLVLLTFYSGSPKLAVLGVVSALVAVVWTLGTLRLIGFGIDPMNILTPFLVFAIGVSHGVQMINGWVNERLFGGEVIDAEHAGTGFAPLEAARRAFAKLLVPGTVALASDVVGFLTILLIPIQIIRELAITASIGVGLVILTNLVLLPILLSYTDYRDAAKTRAKKLARLDRFDGVWRGLTRLTARGPALVMVMVALGLGAYGYIEGQGLQVGDSEAGVPELRPEARFNQDAVRISERFALGVDAITIIAEARPDACTLSYPAMELIDRFGWHLQNIEGVQQVVTLPTAAKIVNAGWNEGLLRWRELPRNPDDLRVATQGFETDTGLLNNDCSAMTVTAFLSDHKASTIDRIVGAVKAFREENDAFAGPGVNLRLKLAEQAAAAAEAGEEFHSDQVNLRLATGSVGVMAAVNERVKEAQMPMMLYVYGAVILLCLLTYRSFGATTAIILPLVMVSLLANALMAELGIGLKVNTLPVAALGVGIGVDYAIYIYSRMKEFLDRGMSLQDAYFRALKLTGTAVLFTGMTLAVGVGTWIFSELKFQADMGVLLSFFFLMNMLGAVLLLPAVLRWLHRDRPAAGGGAALKAAV